MDHEKLSEQSKSNVSFFTAQSEKAINPTK